MPLFSGLACFSPMVSRMTVHAWASNGGSVARQCEERRTALYYFCNGPTDPWVSKLSDMAVVVFSADWVKQCVQNRALLPKRRYVLEPTTFHSAPCLIQTLITTPPHRVIARAQRNTRGLSPCPEIVRELDTSEEEVLEELFWTSNTSTDSLLVRELWKTKRRLSSPEGDSRPAKKQRLYRSGELPAAGLALEARVHGPVDSSSRPPSRRESVDSLASESLASINLPCKEHATSTLLDLSLYLRRSHNKLRSVMKSRSSSPLRLRLLSSRLKHYAHSSVVIDASEDTSLLRTSREHGDLNCLYNKNISQSSSSPHLDAKTILAELSSVDTNGMCIFEEGKVHMGREFRIPRLQ